MKAFIISVISILLLSSIVFSCGEDTGTGGSTSRGYQDGADFGGRDGGGSVGGAVEVVCRGEGAGCSGSDCCGVDSDCAGLCRDLFSGGSIRDCTDNYSRDVINEVDHIVNNVFHRPTSDRLYADIDLENADPLCALINISPKEWIDEVEDYTSPTYARTTLEWVVSQNIWHYFLSEGDNNLLSINDSKRRDDLLALLETLIGKLGGARRGESITTTHLLNGLTAQEVDDEKTVFYLADSETQDENTGFYFIHDEIVVEQLCDESNRPDPNTTGNTRYTGSQLVAARDFDLEACILAVYCKAGPNNDFKSDRETVAKLVGATVADFIEAPIAEGGLDVDEDASEWPTVSCVKLRQYWKNSANLNLGV